MSDFVVGILENFLGDIKKHNSDTGQISFDCPACSIDTGLINGDGKGNLEVNYTSGVFKCWSCKDTNNMSGYIPTLIKRFGNNKLLKQYRILKPDNKPNENNNQTVSVDVKLPESFSLLSGKYIYDEKYCEAIKYLKDRRITDDIIDYYKLGYTTNGKYFLRVIIPSYDSENNLNYFTGRSFSWVKPKYMNSDADKQAIIFNENKINWDATVYLVEGPFDHIVTPNSIPLLGKFISEKLLEEIINKATVGVVIVLDPDAERDAENLYKTLFYTPIGHLVKIVILPDGYDIALIHEKYGKKGVIRALGSAKRLTRFNY